MDSTRLILASTSPRRKQLLAEAGIKFCVVEPPVAEPVNLVRRLSSAGQAEALAYFKAKSVALSHCRDCVLGADTLVAVGDEILGKPKNRVHARNMLQKLSGTRQSVITGVALVGPGDKRIISSDTTYVIMRHLGEDEIEDYLDSQQWRGKAGAYGIQEVNDRFVESIQGSFSNVVGLPMELLTSMLAAAKA